MKLSICIIILFATMSCALSQDKTSKSDKIIAFAKETTQKGKKAFSSLKEKISNMTKASKLKKTLKDHDLSYPASFTVADKEALLYMRNAQICVLTEKPTLALEYGQKALKLSQKPKILMSYAQILRVLFSQKKADDFLLKFL